MTAISIPTTMDPRIQPAKLTRNGKPVSASVEAQTRRLANQIRAYEGKELFSSFSVLPAIDSFDGSSRDRWRFRCKTSPHTTRVHVLMRVARQNVNEAPQPAAVRFTLYDPAQVDPLIGGDLRVGVVEYDFGSAAIMASSDTPDTWGLVSAEIECEGSTEVYGVFTELTYGRLISALVFEGGPDHDTANGYMFPAVAQGADIYTEERELLTTFVNETWIDGGAQVFNLNCNDDGDPYVHTGGSFTNMIDQTSTAVSAATPGFFFDGTGKKLSRETAVPVEMWVYGLASTTTDATVVVKNSAGVVIATVDIDSLTADWYSVAFTLPTGDAKYDLQVDTALGETVSIYSVSIYEVG